MGIQLQLTNMELLETQTEKNVKVITTDDCTFHSHGSALGAKANDTDSQASVSPTDEEAVAQQGDGTTT